MATLAEDLADGEAWKQKAQRRNQFVCDGCGESFPWSDAAVVAKRVLCVACAAS